MCHSLLKEGRGACTTPRLNAKRFERLVIDQIREHILTESNIRDLVRLVDEEMDGIAREERAKLDSVEGELADVRRRMDRLWQAVETSDMEVNDILPRIRQHQERQERLERAASQARAALAERRSLLDSVETITAFAREMSEFLRTSELTESKAFIRSFVREIAVSPGQAVIHYTIPTPPDGPAGGADVAEIGLPKPVISTVHVGSPTWTRTTNLAVNSRSLYRLSYRGWPVNQCGRQARRGQDAPRAAGGSGRYSAGRK